MIEITLQPNDVHGAIPAIKIHNNIDMKADQLAFLLYMLDNGTYGKVLRNKLVQLLPAEQMLHIETIVGKFMLGAAATTNKRMTEQKLEMAKVPIIKSNQGLKIK